MRIDPPLGILLCRWREKGPEILWALHRCSERYIVEVVFRIAEILGDRRDRLTLRERLHGLPVNRRADDRPGVRVLLGLDAAEHFKALEVLGSELRDRVVLEVTGLGHVGELA